jgi:hypothetical protein
MMQTEIDFTLRTENNLESQRILYENKDKINGQCRIVLEALKRGERLTVRDAMLRLGIGDLRRRIKDLIDYDKAKHFGQEIWNIKSSKLPGGFKEYFI